MISSLLMGALMWFIGTIICGVVLELIIYVFNFMIDPTFQTFTNLNNVFSFLSLGEEYGDILITDIIQTIAFSLVGLVMLFALLKSMSNPLVGKECENPLNIIIKSLLAMVLIAIYPTVSDFLIKNFESFIKAVNIFSTKIDVSWVEAMKVAFKGSFDVNIFLNVIIIIAIMIAVIKASITYIERYLSFSLYILLGPICISFLPNKDTEDVFKEWIKGILAQSFTVVISLFLISMSARQLKGISLFGYVAPGEVGGVQSAVVGITTITQLVVLLALLNMVQNSEKYVNALGFRTIVNGDTARSFIGALGTASLVGYKYMGKGKGSSSLKQNLNTSSSSMFKLGNNNLNGSMNSELNSLGGKNLNQAYENSTLYGGLSKTDAFNQSLINSRAVNTPLNRSIIPISKKDFLTAHKNVGNTKVQNPVLSNSLSKEGNRAYSNYIRDVRNSNIARNNLVDDKGVPKQYVQGEDLANAYGLKNTGYVPKGTMTNVSTPEMVEQGIARYVGKTDVLKPDGNYEERNGLFTINVGVTGADGGHLNVNNLGTYKGEGIDDIRDEDVSNRIISDFTFNTPIDNGYKREIYSGELKPNDFKIGESVMFTEFKKFEKVSINDDLNVKNEEPKLEVVNNNINKTNKEKNNESKKQRYK